MALTLPFRMRLRDEAADGARAAGIAARGNRGGRSPPVAVIVLLDPTDVDEARFARLAPWTRSAR